MKSSHRLPLRATSAALALFLVSLLPTPVQAVVDDAHSFAMEAAAPDVENGFAVRDDYWNGILKSGGRELIRHQLFKGNEYAFWLGVDTDGECDLDIKIYDIEGKRVDVTTSSDGRTASVHFAPPKTGSYFIVVSAKSRGGDIPWALAYGYR